MAPLYQVSILQDPIYHPNLAGSLHFPLCHWSLTCTSLLSSTPTHSLSLSLSIHQRKVNDPINLGFYIIFFLVLKWMSWRQVRRLTSMNPRGISFFYPGCRFYGFRGHWLLLVIDMRSMEVFWLDSLVRKVVDLNVKFIVNDAMKVAAMEMGKRIKGNPTWELVKCPKQTGKKECRVYVMKFMKHLMEDSLVSSKSKLKELGEAGTYGDEERNDLRLELVEYILDFINNGE